MSPADVSACRDALLAGGVAIVPTDTVYGCAAMLDDPDAVAALYALKGRARTQPCQVLVYGPRGLTRVLEELPAEVAAVLAALLPGTTTCIVPDPAGRFGAASGDQPGAVGLRAPVMGAAFDVIDMPLIATSANRPGGPDPRTIAAVPSELRAGAAFVLDAGSLPGVASAVVDLRTPGTARLLRPGPTPATLRAALARYGWPVAD